MGGGCPPRARIKRESIARHRGIASHNSRRVTAVSAKNVARRPQSSRYVAAKLARMPKCATFVSMDSSPTARTQPARRSATAEPITTRRAKTTNDPASRANLNTANGRRVADLYRSYLRAMGDPTDAIAQANVLAAAELTVAAETARVQLLAGKADVDQLVKLENLAARAIRRLGIKPGAVANSMVPLRERLRRGGAG
jgi:hypothetical protein